MNKQEFTEQLARKTQLPKRKAGETLDAFLDLIIDTCQRNEKVRLTGFGTFEPYQRKAARRINPRTKQAIQVPARKVPKFRPSVAFKKALSRG
jgi:DNA-binding protein HU-beta